MKTKQFAKGQLLFKEGDSSATVFRLVSGKAVAIKRTATGEKVVGHVSAGEFIGEMGVLTASRRNASTRFEEDSVVESFTRSEFVQLIRHDPNLGLKLLHALSLRTRAQLALLNDAPAVAATTPLTWPQKVEHALEWINEFLRARWKTLPLLHKTPHVFSAASFPRRVFTKGAVLFHEGEISDQVFWIDKGRVGISRENRNGLLPQMGLIRKAEFLGEMGVLESVPRSATARAASEVTVCLITPNEFFELLRSSPAAFFSVLDALCERARRLQKLTHRAYATQQLLDGTSENVFQVASSIDSMSQLAEQRFLVEAGKMRQFLSTQVDRGNFMKEVYQRHLKGKATAEEMEKANVYLRDYLKMAGLGTLFLLPGGMVTIPLAAKIGKAMGVDIFPSGDEEEKLKGPAPQLRESGPPIKT